MADEISGKALADLRAQQEEQVRGRAEDKAPTTKSSMGESAGAFLRNMFGSKESTPKPAPASVDKAKILKDAEEAERNFRNYTNDLMLMDRSKIPAPDVQEAKRKEFYGNMVRGAEHGFKPATLPGSNYGYATPPQWKGIGQTRKHGGAIKKYAEGGSIRGGGIESRGKTKGRFV